jgi:hypothetical protein
MSDRSVSGATPDRQLVILVPDENDLETSRRREVHETIESIPTGFWRTKLALCPVGTQRMKAKLRLERAFGSATTQVLNLAGERGVIRDALLIFWSSETARGEPGTSSLLYRSREPRLRYSVIVRLDDQRQL